MLKKERKETYNFIRLIEEVDLNNLVSFPHVVEVVGKMSL